MLPARPGAAWPVRAVRAGPPACPQVSELTRRNFRIAVKVRSWLAARHHDIKSARNGELYFGQPYFGQLHFGARISVPARDGLYPSLAESWNGPGRDRQ